MSSLQHVEIEQKFLVISDDWRSGVTSREQIIQVYLSAVGGCQVRLRLYGSQAFLTVKGRRKNGVRTEIETGVPTEFIDAVLAAHLHPVPPIVKIRHLVPVGGFVFEIDEYKGENEGLIVAEIELPAVNSEFPRPAWLGEEVTQDVRYGNVYLTEHPFRSW